jgi:hypothetical protein
MRPYAASDLSEINGWYAARNFPPVPREKLPENGRIVPGVAAGFLYLTDSSIALLEGYVTNPSAGLRQRSCAIDEITRALLTEAKIRGASEVVAICAARGIERRAQAHGMRTIGIFAMAAKRLGAT